MADEEKVKVRRLSPQDEQAPSELKPIILNIAMGNMRLSKIKVVETFFATIPFGNVRGHSHTDMDVIIWPRAIFSLETERIILEG